MAVCERNSIQNKVDMVVVKVKWGTHGAERIRNDSEDAHQEYLWFSYKHYNLGVCTQ